jgi:hypothetical protein
VHVYSTICKFSSRNMEQCSACETDSHWVDEGISRILWNQMVQHGFYKSSPLSANLNKLNPFHKRTIYFVKIHFNIIKRYLCIR